MYHAAMANFLTFLTPHHGHPVHIVAAPQREKPDNALFQRGLLTEPDKVPRTNPMILIFEGGK